MQKQPSLLFSDSKWLAGGMWVGLAAGWLQRMNESEVL